MATLRLPGLVDAHVHLRQPGYEHKEDFYTGSAAALAGGVTTVLDMPNTEPPTATPATLAAKVKLAAPRIVCDVGLFVGATRTDEDAYLPVASQACGLKIYVNETFGSLCIDRLALLDRLFRTWAEKADGLGFRSQTNPQGMGPIAVHAEDLMVAACLSLCQLWNVPLHIVHVSRRSEIELIGTAKERGLPVTCEVTPHHLLLSIDDAARLGPLGDMRPLLATPDDVAALWEHLAVVDVFATDHAPHTLAEKRSEKPPPGVPGVETLLPLLLSEVYAGRLEVAEIVERCVHGPRRIYGLPAQMDTWVEVDADTPYFLQSENMHTKVKWTPFHGRPVFGRVEQVTLRGKPVFGGGRVLAEPGSGRVLFRPEEEA